MITNLLDAANESQLAQGHLVTKEQQLDLLGRYEEDVSGGRLAAEDGLLKRWILSWGGSRA